MLLGMERGFLTSLLNECQNPASSTTVSQNLESVSASMEAFVSYGALHHQVAYDSLRKVGGRAQDPDPGLQVCVESKCASCYIHEGVQAALIPRELGKSTSYHIAPKTGS